MNVPRLKSTVCNSTLTTTQTAATPEPYPKSMGLTDHTDDDEQTRTTTEEANKSSLLAWLLPLVIVLVVSLTVIVLVIACDCRRVRACFVCLFESVKNNAAASKLLVLSRGARDQPQAACKTYQPGCLRESATTTTTTTSTQSLRSSSLSHEETSSKQLFMVYNRDDSIRVELIAPLLESQLKSQLELDSIRVEFQHAYDDPHDWTRLIEQSDWVVFVWTTTCQPLEHDLMRKTPRSKRIVLAENTRHKLIRKLVDRERIYELRVGASERRDYSSSLSAASSTTSTTVTGGDAAASRSCSSNEDMRLVELTSSPGSSVTSRNQYYFPPSNNNTSYHSRQHHHLSHTRRIPNECFYARDQHRKFDI